MSDNIGISDITQSHTSGSFFSLKHSPHTVTYTVSDSSHNSASCSFLVEVDYIPVVFELGKTFQSSAEIVSKTTSSLGTHISSKYLVGHF
jgi:hypothetical protein